ncbi:MAG TPA: M67 family metallopeptidase [Acidimicrobiia bacterium]|nr:M67 family metallopeptidase [Acidimicrobiia bacterium]
MTFATPTLRLTRAQYEVIVGHCYDGLPDEACGLLTGPFLRGEPDGRVRGVHPCANADASARTYTVDSRDLLRVMREADAHGDEIIGVWHSHTHTDAYPSLTDVRQAADPTWVYVIVSLRDDAPVLRAYRIRGDDVAEVPVTLH